MTDLMPIRRALLSVSDKTDLAPFARALVSRGVEIISTGGTGVTGNDVTPEALGDYCAGPNHVLPTSATSRLNATGSFSSNR